MKHGSLFSGIGGFDLAAEWMGWENVFHCEINDNCQKLLKYYWPNAKSYRDIKSTDFSVWKGKIDIISGGFPCQPYSITGKRKGTEDDRHLWPEMLRAIRESEPSWIVGENVYGLINWSKGLVFEQVQIDLENSGYEVQAYILPAVAVNAPHLRDRVWFVAHANGKRYTRGQHEDCPEIRSVEIATEKLASHKIRNNLNYQLPEPKTIGRSNGIPVELDGITFSKWREFSISGFGNAVVPQIPYQIFKTIEQFEQTKTA